MLGLCAEGRVGSFCACKGREKGGKLAPLGGNFFTEREEEVRKGID